MLRLLPVEQGSDVSPSIPASGRRLAGATVLFFAVFAVAVVGAKLAGADPLDFFKEPAEIGGFAPTEPWKGSLAMVLVFAWAGAAAVSLLAGAVLRTTRGGTALSSFLLAMGLLFLAFGVDDAFLIHDHVAERITGTSVSEFVVLFALGASVLYWTYRYRRQISASNYLVLLLGGGALLLSVAVDFAPKIGLEFSGRGILEETVEFPGIVAFLVYAVDTSLRALVSEIRAGQSAPAP